MRRAHRSHVLTFAGGFVDLGKHPRFDITDQFTVAAWIKPAPFQSGPFTILSKDYTAYELAIREKKLRFSRRYEQSAKPVLRAERWMHIAVSFDKTRRDKQTRLYINGTYEGGHDNADPFEQTDVPLQIGTRSPLNWGNFIGQMAGIALWSRASTDWQIQTYQHGQIGLNDPDLVGYWPMDSDTGGEMRDLGPGQHHGVLSGNVYWQAQDTPIQHSPPARQLKRNSSVTRHDEIARGIAPDSGSTHSPAEVLPPSGTNGAAHAFMNRAKQIQAERRKAKLAENAALRADALADAQAKRDAAHGKAAMLMNSQRFDKLFFIANGVIHQALPNHSSRVFLVGGAGIQARDLAADLTQDLLFWVEPEAPFHLRAARFSGAEMPVNEAAIADAPVTAVALGTSPRGVAYVFRLAGTGQIYCSPLDGGGAQIIRTIPAPAGNARWQMALDETEWALYWTNGDGIWTTKLSEDPSAILRHETGTAYRIVPRNDAPEPVDLAVDGAARMLYWSDRTLRCVRSTHLRDGLTRDLYAVDNPLPGLTLDAVSPEMQDKLKQDIYWTCWEDRLSQTTFGARRALALDEGQGGALSDPVDIFARTELSNIRLSTGPDALRLARPSDFFALPALSAERLTDPAGCTLAFWVRFTSLDGPQTILSASSAENPRDNRMRVILIRKTLLVEWHGITVSTPARIRPRVWHHITIMRDPARGELRLHLDAETETTAPLSERLNTDTLSALYVGMPSPDADFSGEIADLTLQSGVAETVRANGQRVRVHTQPPPHAPADISLLPRVAPDHTRRWARAMSPPIARPAPAALRFETASDYVHLGRSDTLDLARHAFTVEVWVYPRLNGQRDGTILGDEGNQDRRGLHLILRNSRVHMGFYNDDLQGATTIPDDAWTHLAFRYDSATKEQTVFVNGVRDGNRRAQGPLLGKEEVFLSRSHTSHFIGLMSQLRIWSVARSDYEIFDTMRAFRETFIKRAPVDGSGPVETLFEAPSEGGLVLVSRTKATLEKRLIAARERQAAQRKAAADIASAHERSADQLASKHQELIQAHQTATADVAAKKASLAKTRAESRSRYAAAKSEKAQRIDVAKQQSATQRNTATQTASGIKADAHATAGTRKSAARRKLDAAHRAKGKYS